MNRLQRFLRRRSGILANRKGFAIVLVAALAGLVFLLGASLVVTSQLQSAASQYDQRMRQAREHAMAALEMAVGDLQQRAGRDRAVTILADALRNDSLQDFDDPIGAATSGVHQPFWVGAYDPDATGGVEWLVTRPLRGDADAPDPRDEVTSPVTLVGAGTALPFNPSAQQDLFDVRAPREPLVVSDVPGFSGAVTTGHVAYWVGDLGMKASYALRDKTGQVAHGIYDTAATLVTGARERLGQMRPSHPGMNLSYTNAFGVTWSFDPNDTTRPHPTTNPGEENNVELIDAFVNDFQFRGNSNPEPTRPDEKWAYLNYLFLDAQVKPRFHDFTPLSRGLLIDTRRGGFKKDLSAVGSISTGISVSDPDKWLFDVYEASFRPYSNISTNQTLLDSIPNLIERIYRLHAPEDSSTPAIAPTITQFNLTCSLVVDELGFLDVEYDCEVELWNPYTSAIRLPDIQIEISNLPILEIGFPGVPGLRLELDFNSSALRPQFAIDVADEGLEEFEAGEVKVVRSLQWAAENVASYIDDTPLDEEDDEIWMRFKESVRPAVRIMLGGALARSVRADIGYTLENSDDNPTFENARNGDARFGFTWEVGVAGEDADNPFNPVSAGYSPLMETIPPSALARSDQPDSWDSYNHGTIFVNASVVVLGEKPEGGSSRQYNVPIIELPRQETVSLSHLWGVYYPSPGGGWLPLGEPSAPANALFDSVFFSTIPQEPVVSYPWPNSHIIVKGDDLSVIKSRDSAQLLYVHGSFNINSTSMRAWAAMLKGVAADGSGYFGLIDDVLGNIPAIGSMLSGLFPTSEPRYAFLNHPQSSQEWLYLPENGLAIGQVNATLLDGAVFLEEEDVDELARQIVSEIRKWTDTNDRPFTTIQEFLDARIFEKAIAATGINGANTRPYSPRYLSQKTLMNLLAPFLSARSDTFLVRAFGDVVNPADPEEVWARAYCEAVVQRVHAKHRTEADQNVLTPTSRATQAGQFGREFRVIAFRWLTPDEV